VKPGLRLELGCERPERRAVADVHLAQLGPGGHPLAPLQYKDSTAAFLLWFFAGYFGGHHFYLGRTQRGVAYAVTCVVSSILLLAFIGAIGFIVLFVLWMVDGVQLSDRIRQYNAHAYAVNQSMGYA